MQLAPLGAKPAGLCVKQTRADITLAECANASGVTFTPTFFIDDRHYDEPCDGASITSRALLARNVWTEAWRRIGSQMTRPKAILSVSAHWYGPGITVTVPGGQGRGSLQRRGARRLTPGPPAGHLLHEDLAGGAICGQPSRITSAAIPKERRRASCSNTLATSINSFGR